MIIKVCGMRDAENIREVAALGVDWMGFDFRPDSPRYVQQISSGAGIIPDYSSLKNDQISSSMKRVGVFADEMPQNIVTRVYNYQLDIVQLQGDESPVMIDNLKRTLDPDISPGLKVMKVMRIHSAADLRKCRAYEPVVDYFLFIVTAKQPDDGKGQPDWDILKSYKGQVPFVLGGKIEYNDAVRILTFRHQQFVGIDLNSRFETAPAVKDVGLLKKMTEQLRNNGCHFPWIAIRLAFTRQLMAEQYFKDQGIETFIPMEYVVVEQKRGMKGANGTKENKSKPKGELKPVVRNLLFVKKSVEDTRLFQLMDAFPYPLFPVRKKKYSRTLYEIPAQQMYEFRMMCNPEVELHEYVSEEEAKMKPGAPVLVKFGPLKGLTGRLVRKSKKYYLLKEMPGLGVMLKVARWCCVPL